MNIKFNAVNDNILVKEKDADIKINGIVQFNDGDSPYMFCEVLEVSPEIVLDIKKGDILVIRRYGKEEFIGGIYFVSYKDVRCIIEQEEFNKLCNIGLDI